MLPEFEKLQKECDELKVIVKNKDAIVNTSGNDLMRLNMKNIEIGLQVNTVNQKLKHEVNINRSLRVERKSVEQRLTESTAENQKLKEEIAKLKEEAK